MLTRISVTTCTVCKYNFTSYYLNLVKCERYKNISECSVPIFGDYISLNAISGSLYVCCLRNVAFHSYENVEKRNKGCAWSVVAVEKSRCRWSAGVESGVDQVSLALACVYDSKCLMDYRRKIARVANVQAVAVPPCFDKLWQIDSIGR